MLKTYYLNLNQQENGDYEVHKESCNWISSSRNLEKLGAFTNCEEALRDAKRKHPYKNIDGCKYCNPACHNT